MAHGLLSCAACRRVADLFQSVQLNVNNPHFLIMQGRVTKVRLYKAPTQLAAACPAAAAQAVKQHHALQQLLVTGHSVTDEFCPCRCIPVCLAPDHEHEAA
jgi:hypothetical protein